MLIIIKKDMISSDELIKTGISEYSKLFDIALPEYDIIREDGKKPCLNPTFLKFNLSHSGDYTALAVSKSEVGIDLQQHKDIDFLSIEKRFFHKNEKSQTIKEFFDIWSAKEAYIKNNQHISFIEGIKTFIKNKDITVFTIIENYSMAIDSVDKDYLFIFK